MVARTTRRGLLVAAVLGFLCASGGCGRGSHPPPASEEATRHVYERDCEHDVGSACYELGESYVDGRSGRTDVARGKVLLEKACRLEYLGACEQVARLARRSPRH